LAGRYDRFAEIRNPDTARGEAFLDSARPLAVAQNSGKETGDALSA
jgi:hypothetical protein